MADATRAVRMDMRSIGNAEAKELIAEYTPYIRKCAGKAHANDFEDCVSIAQIALLEAVSQYDDRCGVSLAAWVKRIIRWRIDEYRKTLTEEYMTPVGTPPMGQTQARGADGIHRSRDLEHPWVAPQESLEDAAVRRSMCRLVQAGFIDLDMRNQVLISAELSDETVAKAALTLGITKQRASVLRKDAIDKIRDTVIAHARRCGHKVDRPGKRIGFSDAVRFLTG